MLILSPQFVRFASVPFPSVAAIAIDRAAARLVEDHTDDGAFASLVDVPEQHITLKLVQNLSTSDIPGPQLSDAGEIEIWAASNRSQSQRVKITAPAVITAVHYDLPRRLSAVPAQATRTITFTLFAPDGKLDPISTTDAANGPD